MNGFEYFADKIKIILNELKNDGILAKNTEYNAVSVQIPKNVGFGDLSTNAAMVLNKKSNTPPRELAAIIADKLAQNEFITSTEIAGPGFINFNISKIFWPIALKNILKMDTKYGNINIGQGLQVNVEYVSANPTGPLHIGHCRGAVFGDALANLLTKTGYNVTREYYVNDAGSQIDILARSVYLRYLEASGEKIEEIPAGLYPGEYLIPVGKDLYSKYGDEFKKIDEEEWLPIVRRFAVNEMISLIKSDLKELNIQHDVFFSELGLHQVNDNGKSFIEEMIANLEEKELIYTGILPPPKGKKPDDWEEKEQLLFRATKYNDDIDRPLVKSDGSYTYFAADTAYMLQKFKRGFKQMIYVLGADHSGYTNRLKALSEAITGDQNTIIVRICQLVRFLNNGKPAKMSKRSGDFVTVRDVINEVGYEPVRFMMLYRKNDASMDFDFQKVTEKSRDNPVFYVQYASARMHSIFRNSIEVVDKDEQTVPKLVNAQFNLLQDDAEIAIIRKLVCYPDILQAASNSHEPHRIAFYLYELAGEFHSLWNKGKELPHLKFIDKSNFELTKARLGLVKAVLSVLSDGLRILGIKPAIEML